MYSMVAIFNNNILCTCKLLREEILNVLTIHTHTHTQLCEVMEVLTNLIVIINSQQM